MPYPEQCVIPKPRLHQRREGSGAGPMNTPREILPSARETAAPRMTAPLLRRPASVSVVERASLYNSLVMSFLRYLMLLSLVVWVGGLIFFAFVLAPTAFEVLPTTHLAGNVVGRALSKLHWIGIASAIVFLLSSLVYAWLADGRMHISAVRHIFVCVMLALTLFSQFWIIPRMDSLRTQIGDFAAVAPNDRLRMQFDALHVWSTRVEGVVLLIGLVAIYLAANLVGNANR